ncbi:GNAT family N-acetyltransferase [Robbsia sp. KACC 23696]|uniref:GNAT family N-acetyltransferase n=1 Tax=Robbsia sp. KACC 23696 TaxID=3149231 RepID=UPI00325B9133
MTFTIRPVSANDRTAWHALWEAYCAFYRTTLDSAISEKTWQRLIDPTSPIDGLLVASETGEPLGFCNYVCHPHTWSDRTVCYLEDLFVAPAGRRLGIGTALIEALRTQGIAQGWGRIYWVTDHDNVDAQALYDKVADRTAHVRYQIKLQ